MNEKLQPCPFCGHDDIGIYEDRDMHPGLRQFSAECHWCSATVWGEAFGSEAKAIKSAIETWNTRKGGTDGEA